MSKLNTYVHAVGRDEKGEITNQAVFGPDDVLPRWAETAITNPDVWAEKPKQQSATPTTGDASGIRPPARSGPGSGAADWRAYAAALQVEVPADANRDDVIAALDAAGKPTK